MFVFQEAKPARVGLARDSARRGDRINRGDSNQSPSDGTIQRAANQR